MASSVLRIRLLGGVDLHLDGVSLPPLESARAESLLAYLLLHRHSPQPRQHLAFLFWPDSTEAQALTNLRHVLHTLRRALPESDRFLAVTPRTLQWRADAAIWLDVAAFDEAIARAGQESSEGLDALREAASLYGGDLLPGCYDEWIEGERERLRQRYLDALARLTALLEDRREYEEALGYAERLLRCDPLDEETYRLLMRLHDARGNRAAALRVYHAGAATLERELGVEPAAATRAAYEAFLPQAREPARAGRQDGRIANAPLIGRVAEWARLTTLWREVESGRAQLVLLSGEPGIGKSRLVEDLRSWAIQRGAAAAEAHSYAAEGDLAFGPVVAWLRAEAIRERSTRLDPPRQAELARLLPELGAPLPTVEPLSASEQRLRIFDAAASAILAVGRPLLLVAEDLQWCDQQTLQFLHYLLRTAPDARLLVAATARREEIDQQHPVNGLLAGLQRLDQASEIAIGRLTAEETTLLAASIAGRPFEERAAERLYAETEGNPLFIVEALRAGWRAEDTARQISPKVQAVIESRLVQLSAPARELVGIAATVGRAFSPDTLAYASQTAEESLVQGLDELWRRRIVRDQGDDAYDFSHDKIREVAYLALSPARRQRLHVAVAQGLERLHANDLDVVSNQIAAHWERAAQTDVAITWYLRAADAAQTRYANVEALRLLDHALSLLRTLPDTAERGAREMAILAAQPVSLGWMEGWASQRLATVHRRALALESIRGVPLPSPLLRSLAITSLTQSNFQAAHRFGTQLRERADQQADDVLLVESAYVLGIVAFWQGELAAARDHFETASDRYRPEFRGSHILQYGLDPKVVCLSRLGNTLWFLGEPVAAAQARDEALAMADETGHPFSRSIALVFATMLAVETRDLDGGHAYVEALLSERGERMKTTRVHADALGGYLDVVAGCVAQGMARIQRVLEETRETEHAPGMHACVLRVLLAACAVSEDVEAGLAAAERLIDLPAVHLWEAEARRYRAECLAALGAPRDEVEAEFARALQVARRQGARALELRAAASLLRNRKRYDDVPSIREARDALQALLDAMPAVHGTQEAQEARSLLR